MQRPEVRIVQDQQIENKPVEVSGWEAEQLLRKYGHSQNYSSIPNTIESKPEENLTFEQMIELEESKKKEEENRRLSKLHGPKPTTFDGSRGYDSEVTYKSDEDTGFGFKIEITSDMKIPKY